MVSRSHAHQSHKSRHTKSKRLGIMNNSPSILMHKSRKNRSRY
jgi:hypothetical protein